MVDSHNQATGITPNQIMEIIIRRRWIIIVPFCICLTLGFIYTLNSTQTYQASTTILIQPQKVPTEFVQSIVTSDPQQRINTIKQQILSRTNLEKIIQEFDLFKNAQEMFVEEKINNLRNRVDVNVNRSSRWGSTAVEAFSVAFKGSDPKTVMNVVNKLASLFMDENLKEREVQAVGTSEFLEAELKKIKDRLEKSEEEISAYRAKYMGGLPDELESNLRTLDRLQEQHTAALAALRDNQNAAALLKTQISTLNELAQNNTVTLQPGGTLTETTILSSAEQQYETEKQQLDELLLKYTSKHPEVIRLTKSVAKLKEKLDKENPEKQTDGQAADGSTSRSSQPNILSQQQIDLKQIENEIRDGKIEIQNIQKTMQVYQKRVEDTPKREQELQIILRDYNDVKENYSSVLERRLEAEIAVNMEKKQKGEQFRIIDYARLPEKPISPDIQKLILFSIVAGLGVAGGIIFLLEFVNPVIRTEDQIRNQIGIPILSSIPQIEKPGDAVKTKIEITVFALFLVYAFLIFILFAFTYVKGINKTLNFIQTYI